MHDTPVCQFIFLSSLNCKDLSHTLPPLHYHSYLARHWIALPDATSTSLPYNTFTLYLPSLTHSLTTATPLRLSPVSTFWPHIKYVLGSGFVQSDYGPPYRGVQIEITYPHKRVFLSTTLHRAGLKMGGYDGYDGYDARCRRGVACVVLVQYDDSGSRSRLQK